MHFWEIFTTRCIVGNFPHYKMWRNNSKLIVNWVAIDFWEFFTGPLTTAVVGAASCNAPDDTKKASEWIYVCCSVLQCVAVWCSVVQCVAECCRVLQCVAVCCSVVQCGAVCCRVLQSVAVCCSELQWVALSCSELQWVAVSCSVVRCVAVCCSVAGLWQE